MATSGEVSIEVEQIRSDVGESTSLNVGVDAQKFPEGNPRGSNEIKEDETKRSHVDGESTPLENRRSSVKKSGRKNRRKPCTCDGCELDNAQSISAKNNCWFKFQKKVPTDLISHTISIALLIKNVVTDAKVGYDYFEDGHTFWAIAIWILMFLPALMCFAMELIVKKCLQSLNMILGLLPVGQVWYHFKVILELKQLREKMMEEIDFYSNLDYDNLPSDIKGQLEPSSKNYHDAKDKYNDIMSELKTMKLFDGFFSSAPQFCVQTSILFMLGEFSATQLISVVGSLISLCLAATDIFLTLPTKGKQLKEGTWKPKFLIVLPCMLSIVIPRLLSISLLISFIHGWIFLVVFLMLVIGCLCCYKFIWRDPAKAILGTLTNLFAPTIVIEDGSAFFLKSSMVSNMMHSTCLVIFTISMAMGGFNSSPMLIPCGYTNNSQPSIFHCYNGIDLNTSFISMKRCPVSNYCGKSPNVSTTDCTGIFEPVNDIDPFKTLDTVVSYGKKIGLGADKVKNETRLGTDKVKNETGLGAENQRDNQNENIYSKDNATKVDNHITVCDKWTKDNHFPLIIASSTIVVFLLLSCISIYALHRILNPIGMLLFSRKFRFGNIWPEDRDQKPLLGPVLHFVLEPSKDTLEESNEKLRNKTGEDLIDVSIKHGYGQVIESILSPDVGHPVSGGLLRKALLEGDIKVIKIILGAAKGSEGTLEVDQTKLDAVINELPKVRGGDPRLTITEEKRRQLVATLFGEEPKEFSPRDSQDFSAWLLELQTAATNLTPWMAVAQHVKMEMKEEYQSNWLDQKGENKILTDAFEEAKRNKFEELLQMRKDIEEKNWDNVLITKYENTVKFIINQKNTLSIKVDANEVFEKSCKNGPIELANYLFKNAVPLKIDFPPSTEPWNPNKAFIKACDKGHFGLVGILMENAATLRVALPPPNWNGNECFRNAFANGHTELAEIFIKNAAMLGIDLKWNSNEYFREACENGQSELAATLLKNAATLGIDVNARDHDSRTAFIWACFKGHEDVTRVLMKNSTTSDIDLNAQGRNGWTAFMYACERGHFGVAKVLMENSTKSTIDLNAKSDDGSTAFIWACFYGRTSIVEMMLDKADALQLDLIAKESDGQTGFQNAEERGHTDVVNLIKAKRPNIAVSQSV